MVSILTPTRLVVIEGFSYSAYSNKVKQCAIQSAEALSKEWIEFYRKYPLKVYEEITKDEGDIVA